MSQQMPRAGPQVCHAHSAMPVGMCISNAEGSAVEVQVMPAGGGGGPSLEVRPEVWGQASEGDLNVLSFSSPALVGRAAMGQQALYPSHGQPLVRDCPKGPEWPQ